MLETARHNELEGLVAKLLNSVYIPGRRSPTWRKIKLVTEQEFVIGGWIPEVSDRATIALGRCCSVITMRNPPIGCTMPAGLERVSAMKRMRC